MDKIPIDSDLLTFVVQLGKLLDSEDTGPEEEARSAYWLTDNPYRFLEQIESYTAVAKAGLGSGDKLDVHAACLGVAVSAMKLAYSGGNMVDSYGC